MRSTLPQQVRFLARGFSVPGDHYGQMSHGHRWPYGPVAIIAPFNFPLEIPALQLMGALYMGNKPLLHVDHRVSTTRERTISQQVGSELNTNIGCWLGKVADETAGILAVE